MRITTFETCALLFLSASGLASCVDDYSSEYVAAHDGVDSGTSTIDGGEPSTADQVPAPNSLQGKGAGCNLSGR